VDRKYGNLPPVECYPGKLNQVFLNLMSNAIYAVHKKFGEESGGRISITTSSDEKNVFIKIEDNGTGMDTQVQKKIFEPFFTTKEVGEGTGLGLSIAYNTIKKHQGEINMVSAPGEGATFTIKLPLSYATIPV
jgi:signal transduction histidine kinase